jgi:formylglycine-generating enzyme required for sulfatase activity
MSIPLKTFIIYSRADAQLKDELLTHLHPFVEYKFIEKWVDTDLLPGEDWEKRIEDELEAAHLVIMLVSADALSSEFIRKKELKTALEKKRAGTARVIPILVRDCYWKMHPDLSEIQLLPKDEHGKIKGVAAWLSRDSAWLNCCEELHKLIMEIRSALEKESAQLAEQLETELKKQQEAAEKVEKARHRRDEATWKKVLADVEKTEDVEQKVIALETYLGDPAHLNHQEEAEEKLEDLKADIAATQKLDAARKAAKLKKEAEIKAAEEVRLKEMAAQKQKEEEAREAEMRKKEEAKAAEERRLREAAEQKRKEEETAARQKNLPEMISVKGGTFQMGDKDIADPVHKVTLSDFEIGKYPVTQKLWNDIMGNNPSSFKGEDLPVEQVSWDDCQEFLKKLSQNTGKKYRLPTEAEWEFAARGGIFSKSFQYAGSNDLNEVGWYWENSGDKKLSGEWKAELIIQNKCRTHPIGQKNANELGLFDMSGNVFEWCADWYDKYTSETQTNPAGPASGSYRVLRGGSWGGGARGCRVALRSSNTPEVRNDNIGFRLASSPQ